MSTYNRRQGQTEEALVSFLRERCQQVPLADHHEEETHTLFRAFHDMDRPNTHVTVSVWDLEADENHVTRLPRSFLEEALA